MFALGVPGYLPDMLWGYPGIYPIYSWLPGYLPDMRWGPGTYPIYSGGTRVPTRYTWGYPGTHPIYSGGTQVPTRYTLGVPGYQPDMLWEGTRVPTRYALGVPGYLPDILWGYPGTYLSMTKTTKFGTFRAYTPE